MFLPCGHLCCCVNCAPALKVTSLNTAAKVMAYDIHLFTFFRIVLFADEIFRELYERFCHENLQICENVLDTFVIQPENLVLIKCLYNNSLKHPLLAVMTPTIYRSQHLFSHSSASVPWLIPLFSFPSVRLSLSLIIVIIMIILPSFHILLIPFCVCKCSSEASCLRRCLLYRFSLE